LPRGAPPPPPPPPPPAPACQSQSSTCPGRQEDTVAIFCCLSFQVIDLQQGKFALLDPLWDNASSYEDSRIARFAENLG
jgi:hypothetical protein